MTSYLSNFQKEKTDILSFTIQNCDVSLVNALRRLILSDVETVGFNTEPYNESDIKIIENTSSLHNEFLLQRIGLVPLFVNDVNKFDPSKYKFSLNVQNTSNNILSVTTKDIKITDADTNDEVSNDTFFKANPITNDHILIIKLKPNPNKEGEKLHFEGVASIGNGSKHSRFSPVSCITYINVIDQEKYNAALEKFIEESEGENIDLEAKFKTTYGERYFKTNSLERPSEFEFTIESIGALKPYIIFLKALDILIIKLTYFLNNLEKNSDKVKIQESVGVMKGYDIIINNENHTLGYLLQSYIQILHNDDINFVGYRNPHPLKDNIELTISTSDNNIDKIKTIINSTTKSIIEIINNVKKEIHKEFKVTTIIKKSGSKKIIKTKN